MKGNTENFARILKKLAEIHVTFDLIDKNKKYKTEIEDFDRINTLLLN